MDVLITSMLRCFDGNPQHPIEASLASADPLYAVLHYMGIEGIVSEYRVDARSFDDAICREVC